MNEFQIRERKVDNFRQHDRMENINRTLRKIIRYLSERIPDIKGEIVWVPIRIMSIKGQKVCNCLILSGASSV